MENEEMDQYLRARSPPSFAIRHRQCSNPRAPQGQPERNSAAMIPHLEDVPMSRRPRSPRHSPLDFDLTPDIEATLDALARAGRDDPAARNALFARLGVKISRFLAPWRHRQTALGDFADLQQEAFIIFTDLVADWPGDGSFARYFLAFFPWRIRHAIAYHERRWPCTRIIVLPHEEIAALARHGAPPTDDAWQTLGDLTPGDEQLLALRLAGHTLSSAAAILGWSDRTAARRWRALRERWEVGA
jgi:hypothetical protein